MQSNQGALSQPVPQPPINNQPPNEKPKKKKNKKAKAEPKQNERLASPPSPYDNLQQLEPDFVEEEEEQEYDFDEEDEGIEDYKIGGYHPVHIGEVVMNRYVVLQKLGWGHFSTVWLAKDFKHDNYVALKIQKSAPHYLEASYDEVEILQMVDKRMASPEWQKTLQEYYPNEKPSKDNTHVISLLNSFIHKGPYGNHFCFVFEILGVNLYEIVKRYNFKGMPLHLCRRIAKQVLIGLDFLHRFCGVIHTDLKPENVLLCLSEAQIKEIVEHGRLTQDKAFNQRIREYQEAHGLKISPNIADNTESQPSKLAESVEMPDHNIKEPAPLEPSELESSAHREAETATSNRINALQEKMANHKDELTKNQRKNCRKKLKKLKERLMTVEHDQIEDKEPSIKLLSDSAEPTSQPKQNLKSPMINFKTLKGPKLAEDCKVKIADLGNACWRHHHFATEIQTRQYRSPETILGIKYDTSADIWSFACMLYQMLSGELLFQPTKTREFGKNEHHLALIQERVGRFPRNFRTAAKKYKHYFDKDGQLKHFKDIPYIPLKSLLIHKLKMKPDQAQSLQDFMLPMLNPYPFKRMSARECLKSPWLNGGKRPWKMTEEQYNTYCITQGIFNRTDDRAIFQDNRSDNSDSFDADTEGCVVDEPLTEEQLRRTPINIKLIDQSFSNLGYIGFCDGLNLEELDQLANWQFQ